MPIPNNPLVGSGSNPPSIKSNPSPKKLFGSASTKSRIDDWPYNQSISWYTTRTVSLFLELLTQLLPGTEVSYLNIPGPRVHRVVEVTPLVHPHLHIETWGGQIMLTISTVSAILFWKNIVTTSSTPILWMACWVWVERKRFFNINSNINFTLNIFLNHELPVL